MQTETVKRLLESAVCDLKTAVCPIRTAGDILAEAPLDQIGGKGVFVKDIERCLLAGEIDCAVHSLKDMQAVLPEGLLIGACLEREDPRDMLFSRRGYTLETLPAGSRVGSSSLRRKCQLRHFRPDLELKDIRGNVPTRLGKIGDEFDAVILAAAGVKRLGLEPGCPIAIEHMLPSPGQGVIAVETRADDRELLEILESLNHPATGLCAATERAFLAALGVDCRLPAGAYATLVAGEIRLEGLLGSQDLKHIRRLTISGKDASLGTSAAGTLQAEIHAMENLS